MNPCYWAFDSEIRSRDLDAYRLSIWMFRVGLPNSSPARPHPPRTPTYWHWDSRQPLHTNLLKRWACGRLPLPFWNALAGGIYKFWKDYEPLQALHGINGDCRIKMGQDDLIGLQMFAFRLKTFSKPTLLLTALTCTLLNGAHASTCITAGRMDTAGWAPQFKSVHLLNEAGRVLVVKNKSVIPTKLKTQSNLPCKLPKMMLKRI